MDVRSDTFQRWTSLPVHRLRGAVSFRTAPTNISARFVCRKHLPSTSLKNQPRQLFNAAPTPTLASVKFLSK